MIKDILAANESAAPNSREMKALREHFPGCFHRDGSFDIGRFQELLNGQVVVANEGYELKFLGKNYARLLASLETTTVIIPDEEHNSRPENAQSENIYISGDNLDALKHLLKSYSKEIKCIYIDPPYNTGSDGFIYNDRYNFTAEELSDKLSIPEEQAARILDLTKRGSASHSAWLMYMYPRLQLARDLLHKNGVIFISIDDNECHNLKLLCDDVFGEEHFIAEFPRITKRGGKSSDAIAKNHDYVLMYSRTDQPALFPVAHDDGDFKYRDEFFEERGFYKLNQPLDYDSLQYSRSLDYPLEIDGEVYYPGSSKELWQERQEGIHDTADWAWRWSRTMFDFGYANGFIVVKKSKKGTRIYTKTYQKASIEEDGGSYYIEYGDRTKSLSTLETTENGYSNDNATKDAAATIGKKVFEHTKPIALMQLLISLCTQENDIVLDFFSGSASTAEAVMRQNCADGKARRFIMVQLPELCGESTTAYKNGYRTICDIGQRRIALSAAEIRREYPDAAADLGFRCYTLAEPSGTALDKLERFSPEDNGLEISTLLDDFGIPAVLTTWLVRDGYGLAAPVEAVDFAGYTGYYMDRHLYLIAPGLSNEAIAAAAERYETDGAFNPENVVLFGYSFRWTEIEALKTNLARLKDTEKNLRINFDIRY